MVTRLIIAGVFFVFGAVIAIPALGSPAALGAPAGPVAPAAAGGGKPAPSEPPGADPSADPSASGDPRPGPGGTRGEKHSPPPRPTPSPTPTRTPTPSATPTPKPTPTATRTPTPTPKPPPAVPITARVAKVVCPGGTVKITVVNRGQRTEDYAVTLDEATVLADRVGPKASRETTVTVDEDERATLAVVWGSESVLTATREPNCVHEKPKPQPTKDPKPTKSPKPPKDDGGDGDDGDDDESLPHTGPGGTGVFAKVATGGASMITGVIIFWYGSLWPRRRSRAFE